MATTPPPNGPRHHAPQFDALLRSASDHVLGRGPSDDDVAAAFESTMQRAAARMVTSRSSRTNRSVLTRSNRGVWRSLLGGLVATAGVAFAFIVVRTHRTSSVDGTRIQSRYVTAPTQQATLTLEDGTRVMLAPASELRVIEGFGRTDRTIALRGEAYFTVRPDGSTPFFVRAGRVTARVLGTTFSVRHYAADSYVQVAVTSGKVSVGNGQGVPPLILTGGGVGIATDSSATVLSPDSAQAYAAWTQGQLVFRATPMTEVLATLSRWYGYRFQLADSTLAQQSLTAVLDAKSSARALGTIRLLLNIDLTFDGDVVTLHAREAHHAPSKRGARVPGTLTTRQLEVGR